MASVGELIRCTAHYAYDGAGDCQNVFVYELSSANVTDAVLATALDTFFTSVWGTAWAAIAAGVAELTNVDVEVVNTAGEVVRNIANVLVNRMGGGGQEVMPAGVAGYIAGYTDIPKATGKKYVPGIAEAMVTDGQFTTAGQAALLGLAAAYIADVAGGGSAILIAGLLSKKLEQFVPFTAVYAYNSLPAYQRRRKAGVGI